jgi:hypothetical protein
MKYLLFCLLLLVTSYTIKAADKPTEKRGLEDAWVGEIEDTPTIIHNFSEIVQQHKDLEAFEKYQTFETFRNNLNGHQWLTLIKPSGSLLSVYIPTLRYKKFPYCTAFAIKYYDDAICNVLEVSFDYTGSSPHSPIAILKIEKYDSITHYKRLNHNNADVLVKLYAEALQQEDASRECRKD